MGAVQLDVAATNSEDRRCPATHLSRHRRKFPMKLRALEVLIIALIVPAANTACHFAGALRRWASRHECTVVDLGDEFLKFAPPVVTRR
jgi:hypothetical protein